MFAMSLLQFLIPWEPSIVLPMIFIAAGALYLRGACHIQVSRARRIAFWSGFALFYLALQTRVDYYAEHEFFAHRSQHLVLHHLAPLLVMAYIQSPCCTLGCRCADGCACAPAVKPPRCAPYSMLCSIRRWSRSFSLSLC